MQRFILPFCVLLGACTPPSPEEMVIRNTAYFERVVKVIHFPPTTLKSKPYSNRDLAMDFLDLSFQLESGRFLKNFARFEGTISVRVTGEFAATLYSDLNRLLHLLREDAGLDIFVTTSEDANIKIMSASSIQIQRTLTSATCFVAPIVTSLKRFRSKRGTQAKSWSRQKIRTKVGIFLPNDVDPKKSQTA
jgi:hypothetical protein